MSRRSFDAEPDHALIKIFRKIVMTFLSIMACESDDDNFLKNLQKYQDPNYK